MVSRSWPAPAGSMASCSPVRRGTVVVVLVVGSLQLDGRGRGDTVLEVEVRELRAQPLLAGDRAVDAVGVVAGRELERLERLVLDERPSAPAA